MPTESSTERSDGATTPAPRRSLRRVLLLLGAAVLVVIYGYWYSGRPRTDAQARAQVFAEKVAPEIRRNHAANAQTLEKFRTDVHAQFDQYRQRVPAFVEDITGWGNRIKIAYEGTKELASSDNEKVERHVAGKFALHIVSPEGLEKDLQRLLVQFRQGIDANRNEMLGKIEAAVSTEPALNLRRVGLTEGFSREMERHIREVSAQAGRDSVQIGGLTLLTSVLTEEATRLAVTAVLGRVAATVGASAAATAAAAGGTTAAATGAGAAGGTTLGPAGTAAGVIVGLGVGMVVDAVMTTRLQKQLAAQCEEFLTRTEKAIIEGGTSVAGQLGWAVDAVENVTEPVLRRQLEILP